MSLLPNLPQLPNALDGAQAASTNASPSSGGILADAGKWIGAHLPGSDAFNAYMNKTFPSLNPANRSASGGIAGLSFSRVSAFAVGLLLIGGAVLLFKENVSVVNVVTKSARRATQL
jgi:hypothetical protein